MGLLDGGLRDSIYAAFAGKLLTGTFYKRAVPESGALDKGGRPLDGQWVGTDFEGFIDEYSAFTRAKAGFPDSDLKLCIFAASMPDVAPIRSCVAKITDPAGSMYVGKWYEVRKEAIDPAGALWELQSFEIAQPEDIS